MASSSLKVLLDEVRNQTEILVHSNWDSSQSQKCLHVIFQLNNLIGFFARMDRSLKDRMLQLQNAINGVTVSIKAHDVRRLRDSITSAEAILNSFDDSGANEKLQG